jgi:hypothetical protein
MLCALVERKVVREVLESSSAVLQAAADHRCAAVPASQLPAQVVLSGHQKTRCHLHL